MRVSRVVAKKSTVPVSTDRVLLFYSKNRYNPEHKEVVDRLRDILIKSQKKSGRFGRMLEIPTEISELVQVVSCLTNK